MALYDSDPEDEVNPGPGKPLPAVISAPPMLNIPKKEEEPPPQAKNDGAKDVSMKFLAAHIQTRRSAPTVFAPKTYVTPVIDLSARVRNAPNMKRVIPPKPRPITDGAPLSFLPKTATDDSILMFGEVTIKNEYQPALPNDYLTQKKKKEEREAKEKAAREIAERFAQEHKEEARKRDKGAAIAPPSIYAEEPVMPPPAVPETNEEPNKEPEFKQPSFLPAFGKGTSRGLGVAASIMSKYGYKEGSGLGRDEQGISKALSVEKMGRNSGVIKDETGIANAPMAQPMYQKQVNTTAMMSNASKILLMTNMVGPNEIDSDLESDVREELGKCGQVNSVVIHKVEEAEDTEAVRIFVEFTNIAQAIKANIVMNGRFFAGRQVTARFYNADDFSKQNYDK